MIDLKEILKLEGITDTDLEDIKMIIKTNRSRLDTIKEIHRKYKIPGSIAYKLDKEYRYT